MAHISTIKLLRAWAQWGAGHNISYPTMSPMFGERCLKSPLYGIGHVPDDVMLVEIIVCSLSFEHRDALIQRYQRRRTWEQMAERMGCRWRSAKKKTQEAEDDVHRRMSDKVDAHVGEMLQTVDARKLSLPEPSPSEAGVFAFRTYAKSR